MKRFNRLSSFSLKIIAMVTMTFDHIGVVYDALWGRNSAYGFWLTCRYIGRLALPLYCFLLVEAVLHTKNYKKYNIKLGIMAGIISIGLALAQFIPNSPIAAIADAGNIMIYCLNHKEKWVKPLAILPFGYSVLSFVVKAMERASCPTCYMSLTTTWFPGFMRLQYDWFSLAFMLGFYLSYKIVDVIYKIREEQTGLDKDAMKGTDEWRVMVNLVSVFFTVFVSIIYHLFYYINPDIVFWIPSIQIFSIAAGLFIAFYSGTRGYNAKWFNNFAYVYYLVHIAVIFGVCYLIYIL